MNTGPDQVTREERGYHHGDLRDALLAAAVQHIASQGMEGLSLRALAREVGVSATAPYRHFETRQALLAALASQGFHRLAERMKRSDEHLRADPLQAFMDAGLEYVQFAREHPVHYHVMFGDMVGDFSAFRDLLEGAMAAYGEFEHMLAICVEEGALRPLPVRELGGIVWSMVHGIAGMTIGAQRKRAAAPLEHQRSMPPLEAQARVLDSPARVLHQLSRGLVTNVEAWDRVATELTAQAQG